MRLQWQGHVVHHQTFFIGTTRDQELGWLLGDRDETAPAAPKSSQARRRDRQRVMMTWAHQC